MRAWRLAVPIAVGLTSFCICIFGRCVVPGALALALVSVSVILLLQSNRYEVPVCPVWIVTAACVVSTFAAVSFPSVPAGLDIDSKGWNHIMGIIYWTMSFPTAYLIVAAVVNHSGARYNRFLVYGFTAFVSIAVMTIIWALIGLLFESDLDSVYTSSMEDAYLFTDCVLSFSAAAIAVHRLNGTGMVMERRSVEE